MAEENQNLVNDQTQIDRDNANYIKKDGSVAYVGTGDGFKDEDDMASDSAIATASQQSIKAYIDAGSDLLIKSFIAGEEVVDGNALCIVDGTESISSPEQYLGGDTSLAFGRDGSNNQKAAQSFQSSETFTIDKISVYLDKANSPADNVRIAIQSNSGGLPSGTELAFATKAGADIAGDTYELTLNNEIEITANTLYWIVFSRSGSLNDSVYYTTLKKAGNNYTNGNGYVYTGSWVDDSSDINFNFHIPITAGYVYRCRATDINFIKFVGIANAAAGRSDSVNVIIKGIKTKAGWGLTVKTIYYLSNTVGGIGTAAGTNALRIGISLSATELLILDEFEIPADFSYVASDNLQASADTERTTTSLTYVLKKEIKVNFGGTIRVKFDMKSWDNNPAYHTYGRIYVNGSAVGIERDLTDDNYVTYSEDFTIVKGDLVQLYLKVSTAGGTAYCKNFRLYFTKTILAQTVVNTD